MPRPLTQDSTVKPPGRFPTSADNEFGNFGSKAPTGQWWLMTSKLAIDDRSLTTLCRYDDCDKQGLNTRSAVDLHATDARVCMVHIHIVTPTRNETVIIRNEVS